MKDAIHFFLLSKCMTFSFPGELPLKLLIRRSEGTYSARPVHLSVNVPGGNVVMLLYCRYLVEKKGTIRTQGP